MKLRLEVRTTPEGWPGAGNKVSLFGDEKDVGIFIPVWLGTLLIRICYFIVFKVWQPCASFKRNLRQR